MNMNDEVICGYPVSAKKKRANAVYLDLLREFDSLCKAAGLTYWVVFGALIGAVRHKGFIPWDDDIDVIMPREDFDRLRSMTLAEFGAKEPYFLQNPVNDPTDYEFLVRFRRSDTTAIMDADLDHLRRSGMDAIYNMGIGMTVFPLDNMPASKLSVAIRGKLGYACLGIAYRHNYPDPKKPLQAAVCNAIWSAAGPHGLMNGIHKCFRCSGPNKSGKVYCLDSFYKNSTIFDLADFAQTVMLPFEDAVIPVPVGYEHLLTVGYGNYMEFPPVEQRFEKHGGYVDPDTPYLESLKKLMPELEK